MFARVAEAAMMRIMGVISLGGFASAAPTPALSINAAELEGVAA